MYNPYQYYQDPSIQHQVQQQQVQLTPEQIQQQQLYYQQLELYNIQLKQYNEQYQQQLQYQPLQTGQINQVVPVDYSQQYSYDYQQSMQSCYNINDEEDINIIDTVETITNPTPSNPAMNKKSKKVNMTCNSLYNINDILVKNILLSDYYNHTLLPIDTFHNVIDEIKNKVSNLEPFIKGMHSMPTTAFCLLYKLCTMGMTIKQLDAILTMRNAPFVRGLGFIFLRYVTVSDDLYSAFEPYFNDKEIIKPTIDETITVGEFVKILLKEQNYYGTLLPRIKEIIKRDIDKKFLEMELNLSSYSNSNTIISKTEQSQPTKSVNMNKNKQALVAGALVTAIYHEDSKWYDAKIIEVTPTNKYKVVFTEYGNEELVDITQIKIKPVINKRSRSRSPKRIDSSIKHSRSPRRSRSPHNNKTAEEILRDRARDAAATSGKDYAKRVVSLHSSLILKQTSGSSRKRSVSPPRHTKSIQREQSPPKVKVVTQEHIAKLEKLKSIYGDTNNNNKNGDYL